jgi:tight adherence protein B
MGQVMPRLRAGVLALVLLLGISVALAPVATADDAKSVQVVSQDGRDVTFLVYLDPNAKVDAASAISSSVLIGGVDVPSEAKAVVEDTKALESILVLDVSGSMRGERLTQAKAAATSFVNTLPADVAVGLATFNDTVTIDVQPTKDKQAVIAGIDAAKAGQKTALYDAINAGLDLADPKLGGRLLVLSDGGDTASLSTLEEVTQNVADSGIPVDIVALTPNVAHAEILKSIASSSGGQFILATDAGGLARAFDEATGSFGSKVTVDAQFPEDVEASGRVAVVAVNVDGTDFRGTAKLPDSADLASTTGTTAGVVTFPETTTPVAADDGGAFPWLYALLAALIVIIFALTIAYYQRQQKAYMRTQQVLWYSDAAINPSGPAVKPDFRQAGLVRSLDNWLATKKGYPAKEAQLDNAELNMTPASWLIIRLGVTAVIVLLLAIILSSFWIGLLVGALIGWLGTGAYVSSRENKRRKSFEEELPDFLLLIASALRSGLSFNQALDSTAAEGKGQVSRQIRRALREVQMGSSIEDALTRVADRMQSDDLRWTVTALAIQREVGGNLSNILDTAAQTVKGRAELAREVRTLAAEGKLSGWVLAALPIGLFLYMLVANRAYIAFFWTTTAGIALLVFIAVIFTLGFIWMRRLVKIEV